MQDYVCIAGTVVSVPFPTYGRKKTQDRQLSFVVVGAGRNSCYFKLGRNGKLFQGMVHANRLTVLGRDASILGAMPYFICCWPSTHIVNKIRAWMAMFWDN